MSDISLEDVRRFFRFLQGEVPEGFRIEDPPMMETEDAFQIIYMLQEDLGVIPDHFEVCKVCGLLYDKYCGGIWATKEYFRQFDQEKEKQRAAVLRDEDVGYYCDSCKWEKFRELDIRIEEMQKKSGDEQ